MNIVCLSSLSFRANFASSSYGLCLWLLQFYWLKNSLKINVWQKEKRNFSRSSFIDTLDMFINHRIENFGKKSSPWWRKVKNTNGEIVYKLSVTCRRRIWKFHPLNFESILNSFIYCFLYSHIHIILVRVANMEVYWLLFFVAVRSNNL